MLAHCHCSCSCSHPWDSHFDRSLPLQEWDEIQFNGVYYAPPKQGAPGAEPTFDTSYTFQYPRPKRPENLRIYECHVGMSSEEPKVAALSS